MDAAKGRKCKHAVPHTGKNVGEAGTGIWGTRENFMGGVLGARNGSKGPHLKIRNPP
jgi:hypothetical protein